MRARESRGGRAREQCATSPVLAKAERAARAMALQPHALGRATHPACVASRGPVVGLRPCCISPCQPRPLPGTLTAARKGRLCRVASRHVAHARSDSDPWFPTSAGAVSPASGQATATGLPQEWPRPLRLLLAGLLGVTSSVLVSTSAQAAEVRPGRWGRRARRGRSATCNATHSTPRPTLLLTAGRSQSQHAGGAVRRHTEAVGCGAAAAGRPCGHAAVHNARWETPAADNE